MLGFSCSLQPHCKTLEEGFSSSIKLIFLSLSLVQLCMETLYQSIPTTQPPITRNSCSIPFQRKARNADSCQHFPTHFYVAVFLPLQLCRCSCTVCCAAVLYGCRTEGTSRADEPWGQHIWGRAAPWLAGNRDRATAKGSVHTAKMSCVKVAMRSYPGNNCLTPCCNKEEFSYFQLPSNDEAQLTSWPSKFCLQSLWRVRHIQRVICSFLRYRSKADLFSADACLYLFKAEARDYLRLGPRFYHAENCLTCLVIPASRWPLHRHVLLVNKPTDLQPHPREIMDC